MRVVVYDAQASQRKYPNSYPSEAIVEVWDGDDIAAAVYVSRGEDGVISIRVTDEFDVVRCSYNVETEE
jgi:hypothetical protein